MCLFANPTDLCNHLECLQYYYSQNPHLYTIPSAISGMTQIIHSQSEALRDLLNKSALLTQKIEEITERLNKSQNVQECINDEHFNIENIFKWISSGVVFNMYISLVNEIPRYLYKEKGFQIIANVISSDGTIVVFPNTNPFVIKLFTVENPPKLLKNNISGKKILRGTTETAPDSNGIIHFRNVVINEVTSHYPNDSLLLVVICPGLSYIKPLATSGISIRARKHRKDSSEQ